MFVVVLVFSHNGRAQGRLYLPGLMNYFSCDSVHRVRAGETCDSIAQEHNIKVTFLLWKNKHLRCENGLRAGSKLCVDKWIWETNK